MLLDNTSAAVDNDFISHVIESRILDDELIKSLRTIFSELNLTAVVHPLVHEKEVQQDKPRVHLLTEEGILHIAAFSDIFQGDPDRKNYYILLVKELYRHLKGTVFPVGDEAILTYWVRRQSLGEVHSVSMCLVCGSGIFLSDDGDARALAAYVKRMCIGTISVYNRAELIDKHIQEGSTKIARESRKSLAHVIR